MKASQQAIERGVKDCVFIDYKRRSGHFDVTTVASIKEITEKVISPHYGFYCILGLSTWHMWIENGTAEYVHHCFYNLSSARSKYV